MARASLKEEQARMKRIVARLKKAYPDAACSLTYRNPFQLLVATILSAQCTDERVNRVTPGLFRELPTVQAMAEAPLSKIEALIQSTGFYKNKALALQGAARTLLARHGGEVPRSQEELTSLRGVGRKTANVVLGNAFGQPGIVVDTHVGRITRRMGFTQETDPVKVEHRLMELVDRRDWTIHSHLLIAHGRATCTARRAHCDRCPVGELCPRVGVQK